MTISDGIVCARLRLDVLEKKVVLESEMSSDSDHGEKEVETNVRIKIKNAISFEQSLTLMYSMTCYSFHRYGQRNVQEKMLEIVPWRH